MSSILSLILQTTLLPLKSSSGDLRCSDFRPTEVGTARLLLIMYA